MARHVASLTLDDAAAVLNAALAPGASVRRLAKAFDLTRTAAHGALTWAPRWAELLGPMSVEGAPGPTCGQRSFYGADGIAGPTDQQAPPEEKPIPALRPEPPAEDQKNETQPPAPADDFADVPEPFRSNPTQREAYRQAMRGAS